MQIVRKNLAFYGAKLFDAHDVLMKMHKRYIKFDEKPTEYMEHSHGWYPLEMRLAKK